jgi:hypothetical protein
MLDIQIRNYFIRLAFNRNDKRTNVYRNICSSQYLSKFDSYITSNLNKVQPRNFKTSILLFYLALKNDINRGIFKDKLGTAQTELVQATR